MWCESPGAEPTIAKRDICVWAGSLAVLAGQTRVSNRREPDNCGSSENAELRRLLAARFSSSQGTAA